MLKRFATLLIGIMLCCSAYGSEYVDSLRAAAVDPANPDTMQIKAIWKLSVHKEVSDEEGLELLDKCERMCEVQPHYKWLADNFRQRATYYYFRGKLPLAAENIERAIVICRENGDKHLLASMLSNLGILHRRMDNYVAATDALLTAEKLYIEADDRKALASTYNNLGNLYHSRKEYDMSEAYFFKSIEIRNSLNDNDGLSANYLNLGNLAMTKKEFDKALSFYQRSAAFQVKDGSPVNSAMINNIGSLYMMIGKYDSAAFYLDSSYAMRVEERDEYGQAMTQNNRASLALELGDYETAIEYATNALMLCDSNGITSEAADACRYLERAYFELNDIEAAYKWSTKKQELRDSIWNTEQVTASTRVDMQHSFEKRLLADSISIAKQKEIDDAELASANAQKYALYGGMGATLVLVAVVYRGYRRKKEDNVLILEQKELVEEKNREIVDSINYAKRLQDAILPSKKFVSDHFPDSFVLFLPKDIVAGDFYWMEVVDDTIFIAAADCTGHGVPGAMVSVVCSNALNKVVLEMRVTDPGQILDKTRELVAQHFDKGEGEVKDGMDISFCAINKASKSLKWAGAYNPLWIVRNGELIEQKADKQAIGKVDAPTPFTTHEISLQNKDTLYVFSDGYADQFGGVKGKKLKSANLKKLLLELQSQNMQQQSESLHRAFTEWKGDLEQLDDVCIIGIRM